ncbi:hypothetical protein TIFTF001_022312 [Ficus carica]|uniref:Uncharacterized protein n=1 Tax=Ficus carica TaxID=3494 RepID=A0AA88AJQ4_FICCA|nr:hypothetical protein TIFTF001_022312 [Ficus carica]
MMSSKFPHIVLTCTRTDLVHGLSWTELAAPTTPLLRATVSNLMAICDARRWSIAGRTVMNGNCYAFCDQIYIVTELVSEQGVPAFQFHRIMDDDRAAAYAFHGMLPLIFDKTRRTVSLAGWLQDMELIFRICHIEAHLQVLLASRCLAVDVFRRAGDSRRIDAMLPHIPRDLGNPELQALHLPRVGLPPEVKQLVPAMMMGVTLETSIITSIKLSNVTPFIVAGTNCLTSGGNPSLGRCNACNSGLPKSRGM